MLSTAAVLAGRKQLCRFPQDALPITFQKDFASPYGIQVKTKKGDGTIEHCRLIWLSPKAAEEYPDDIQSGFYCAMEPNVKLEFHVTRIIAQDPMDAISSVFHIVIDGKSILGPPQLNARNDQYMETDIFTGFTTSVKFCPTKLKGVHVVRPFITSSRTEGSDGNS